MNERMSRMENFFDLSEVPFSDLFGGVEYVWEVLNRRDPYIRDNLCPNTCSSQRKDIRIEGEVYVGEGTVIESGAYIRGPTIIGKDCQIRHGAYIRGGVITGDHCVIGHTTEVIRSILLNHVRADHFAYVGDSVLGSNSHLGAGVILANVKMRMSPTSVKVRTNGTSHDTGMRKMGGILGDDTEIGCNSVTNPGTLLEKGVTVYPGITIGGYCRSGTVIKTSGHLGEPRSVFLANRGGSGWGDPLACPNCGQLITRIDRVKEMIGYCKELKGQCSCGQKYAFTLSPPNTLVLSFPDRQVEIVC
ncbi:MAG: glucose-1-phosphate thymidylyltransferase [Deltaproteobacteria bacterium]|nr:glucose-1-phosphate thymidylyltransferase [Deltaproteobacteria bacterium]MBW2123519.1 glucose-1-phosphate thymidylyltransferase [Deltaproteobacteria bacterium]